MNIRDIQRVMDAWAPPEIAWERDATGLQCGDPGEHVRGILVALDPTDAVVAQARRKRANLIVTHHPLLFRPLRTVTPASPEGRCLWSLIRHNIAMFSAHTNLDFTRGGTSFALAEVLGLVNVVFLHRPYRITKKVVAFVPAEDADRVADAMAAAGAGTIGNYDQCSFRLEGTGTFRGNAASSPRRGSRGVRERVPEVRLEMVVPSWRVDAVVVALRKAHPYEEVAYDIYPLENPSADHGMGVVGDLRRPVRLGAFLSTVRTALRAEGLRYAGNQRQMVRRIALCGGSGADLIPEAARAGADVFVTADLKYHAFHLATPTMALVDAGHFETELPVVGSIVRRLKEEIRARGARIRVSAAVEESPVHFVLH